MYTIVYRKHEGWKNQYPNNNNKLINPYHQEWNAFYRLILIKKVKKRSSKRNTISQNFKNYFFLTWEPLKESNMLATQHEINSDEIVRQKSLAKIF